MSKLSPRESKRRASIVTAFRKQGLTALKMAERSNLTVNQIEKTIRKLYKKGKLEKKSERWEKTKLNKLNELRDEDYTRRQMAEILDSPFERVACKIKEEIKKGSMGYKAPGIAFGRLLDNQKYLKSVKTLRREAKKFDDIWIPGRKTRILCLADPHIPFHYGKGLLHVLKNVDADICIFSEFLDMYSMSRFRKDQLVSLRDEILYGKLILEEFSKKYRAILIDDSNHMQRVDNLFKDRFKDLPEIVDIFGKEVSIYKHLIKGLDNVYPVKSWYIKIAQTFFVHPHWNSKIAGRACKNSWEFLSSIGEFFEAVVTFHTHKMDKHHHLRKWLITAPCICEPMMYMNDSKHYNAEQAMGYTIITLDENGHFLPNESHPYWLAWE